MLETAILLLIVVAACVLVRAAYHRALLPDSAEDTWAVVCGRGSGDGLEQRVRCLMSLRECGLLRCHVALTVGDLNAEGRELACNLAQRWPELELWNEESL